MSQTAFLFPGQGAQSVGMGRQLAETHTAAGELFDRAATILGYDLAKICFEGPAEKLDSTVHSQPALFVTSLAALEKLKRDSPELVDRCAAAAGLSLGEYTALVFGGVMEFEPALRVVQERGRAMQDAADAEPSGMISVLGMERQQVESLVEQGRGGDTLEIANLLCPGNIVVSGLIRGTDPVTAQPAATLEEQCALMFLHMRGTVEAAGGTVADIIKVTVWMKELVRAPVNAEWTRMFPDPASRPARQIMELAMEPGVLVQCDFMAVLEPAR